jgi:hypothetical protein
MGERLWIPRIRLSDALPDLLSLGILTLLFQRERLRTRIILCKDEGAPNREVKKQDYATPKFEKHLIFPLERPAIRLCAERELGNECR